MSLRRTLVTGIVFAGLVAGSLVAFVGGPQDQGPPPLPKDPFSRPVTLVESWPFAVAEPYAHTWQSEQPQVSRGVMLVLAADREMLHPRQGLEPVLYVGGRTAERVNTGELSGYLVVLVPGDVDLADSPIFFGTPALPEQVDAGRIAAELASARRKGVRPPDAAMVAKAARRAIEVKDQHELYLEAAMIIERVSPNESDLVNGLRAPLVK